MRRRVVGVMGSGREEHADLAVPLGRLVAALGAHLLTGGGAGCMRAVSAAFHAVQPRAGLCVGVVPGVERGGGVASPAGYPNEHVELVLRTHLPLSGTQGESALSRNHINVLSSDAIVALPGGAGTASEIALALRYGRPVLAYLGAAGTIDGERPRIPIASELQQVEDFLRAQLALA